MKMTPTRYRVVVYTGAEPTAIEVKGEGEGRALLASPQPASLFVQYRELPGYWYPLASN